MSFYDTMDTEFLCKLKKRYLKKVSDAPGGLIETLDESGELHSINGAPSKICLVDDVLFLYWHDHGVLQSFNDKPAIVEFTTNTKWFCFDTKWYEKGELHRIGGPAVVRHDLCYTSCCLVEHYYENGELHRIGGPAVLEVKDDDGRETRKEEYYERGVAHRLDGPAIVSLCDGDSSMQWLERGRLHRQFFPAVIKHEREDLIDVSYYNQGKLRISSGNVFERARITLHKGNRLKAIRYVEPEEGDSRRLVSSCVFHKNGLLKTIVWNKSTRIDEPLLVSWNSRGIIKRVMYDSRLEDWDVLEPCDIRYVSGEITRVGFMSQGKMHNVIGPSIVNYDKNGEQREVYYHIMGVACSSVDEWREKARIFAREEKNQSMGILTTDISI